MRPVHSAAAALIGLAMTSACVGNIQAPAGAATTPTAVTMAPGEVIPPFDPAPLAGRLLLSFQYVNALHDVLGAAAASAVTPPLDIEINGLAAIGSSQLSLSTSTVQAYETNAYLAAQAALATPAQRAALYGCTPTHATDDACFTKFLNGTGAKLLRRPLTSDEVTSWTSIQHAASAAYSDFDKGVEFALAGILMSPSFLYRFEVGEPDPADATRLKLTPNELATRLSFFLAGTTPTDALLGAATTGGLDTPAGIRAQATLLLGLPTAPAALLSFFDEVFQMQALDTLSKDSTVFPDFDPTLTVSMREETHRLLQDLAFDTQGDFRTWLDADYAFVDTKLATLYGLSAPSTAWQRVSLSTTQPRLGLLGEATYLSLEAHPASTSPTKRGKLIRENLLCEPVAAPPPNVNTQLPDDPPTGMKQTMRQKLADHMTDPSCSACHTLMDPLGFAFENFDALGQYRTLDNGLPIDASGNLDGQGFSDARGLLALLKDDPRVTRCLTTTVYRQAAGHVELAGETAPLRAAESAFVSSGYSLQELMVQLTLSDAFRYGKAAP